MGSRLLPGGTSQTFTHAFLGRIGCPGSPSQCPVPHFPGRNHEAYLAKRNRLLEKLMEHKVIDSLTCRLAKEEPLPGEPLPLPSLSPHLLARAVKDGYKGKILRTTIDRHIQQQALRILERHHRMLAANEINNAAIIILEVETGNVPVYIGNTNDNSEHSAGYVDIITSLRSPGEHTQTISLCSSNTGRAYNADALLADIPRRLQATRPLTSIRNTMGQSGPGMPLPVHSTSLP